MVEGHSYVFTCTPANEVTPMRGLNMFESLHLTGLIYRFLSTHFLIAFLAWENPDGDQCLNFATICIKVGGAFVYYHWLLSGNIRLWCSCGGSIGTWFLWWDVLDFFQFLACIKNKTLFLLLFYLLRYKEKNRQYLFLIRRTTAQTYPELGYIVKRFCKRRSVNLSPPSVKWQPTECGTLHRWPFWEHCLSR